MKTLNIFLAIAMAFSTISISNAQTNTEVNDTVKVWGNCSMCQSRIEKAAKEAGATAAKWDEDTKILSVSYVTSKSSLKTIEEKIASVGHDTQNIDAGNDVYNKLPGCCKYDRKMAAEKAVSMCCKDNAECAGKDCSKATAGKADCCKAAGDKMACCSKTKTCCSKQPA